METYLDIRRRLVGTKSRPGYLVRALERAGFPRPWGSDLFHVSWNWLSPPPYRADLDNVSSGGRKLMMDALVVYGTIPDDGPRFVGASLGDFFVPGPVGVEIVHGRGPWFIPCAFPTFEDLMRAEARGAVLRERRRLETFYGKEGR